MNANAPACPKKIEGKFNNYQEMTMNMGQKFLFLRYVSPKKQTTPEFLSLRPTD